MRCWRDEDRGGRYRIVRLLGEGEMGAVYEALQLPMERRVPLELIRRLGLSLRRAAVSVRDARHVAGRAREYCTGL